MAERGNVPGGRRVGRRLDGGRGRKHDWPAATMKKIIDTTETQRDAFRRALAHGVRIGFGTYSASTRTA